MTAQTKGPWAWQRFGKEWCLTGQHGMRPIVLSVRKGRLTSLVDGLLQPLDPAHPDARLITMAPNLLASLEAAVRRLETIQETHPDLRLAGDIEHYSAVIGIAKGDSP